MINVLCIDAGTPIFAYSHQILSGSDLTFDVFSEKHGADCTNCQFELAIMDVDSALERDFANLAKFNANNKSIPVLVLLSPEIESSAAAFIKGGAADLMIKTPAFFASLGIRMEQVVRRNRLELEIAELRQQRDRLLQAQEHKRQFLRAVGHELRTPLVGLRIYTQFLASGRMGALTPQQTEKVEAIYRNAERLTHCIESIQRFERLESDRIESVPIRFDLRNLLNEVLAGATRPCMEKGISLGRSWPMEPLMVLADRELITDVLRSIIDNAIAFTEPKGSVTIAAAVRGHDCVVSITDTGCGIPAEMLPRLFESRWHLAHSSEGRSGGLGLGLAVAKRILDLHGSKIDVNSSPENGTRFKFTLPLASGPELHSVHQINAAQDRKHTVLVVDDDEDNLACMRSVLEVAGYRAVCANGLIEAREQLGDGHVDAVLMDIAMQGTSGLETLRRFKHHPATSGLPVIMVSARADDDARAEASREGAAAYVVKPFTPARLIKELECAIADSCHS